MTYDADVIVIGAGLAGLVATAELVDAGRRFSLVDEEPEQSIGGQARWSFGGLIFVHRRTASKLVFPSYYDMFVGGVLGAGEDYAGAALREAEEELGVRGLEQPAPLFTFLYEGPGGAWWSSVYEVRCELPVSPQVSEVDWHAWLTPEELERRVADDTGWAWVPDGLEAYRRLREFRKVRQ